MIHWISNMSFEKLLNDELQPNIMITKDKFDIDQSLHSVVETFSWFVFNRITEKNKCPISEYFLTLQYDLCNLAKVFYTCFCIEFLYCN